MAQGGSGNYTYQWQWDMSGKDGWINLNEQDAWVGTKTPELTFKSQILLQTQALNQTQ